MSFTGIFGGQGGIGTSAQNSANAANQQANQQISQQQMQAQQGYPSQVFIPSGTTINGTTTGGLLGYPPTYTQSYQYQYTPEHRIQGVTEAIIGYSLYENGIPKEQHESFIGKHHVKLLECYHKDNYAQTLTNLKELVKQLKFDGEMSSLLDD